MFWLKTTIKEELISKYFDEFELDKKKICKYLKEARDAISKDYVPFHLGQNILIEKNG